MSEANKLEEIKNAIEKIRDEVALKAHLGKADATDELEKLEKKWENLKRQFKPYADDVEKKTGDAGAAIELAAEEIKAGFERIKNIF
jgi:uncharacterized protein YerC